MNSDEKIEALAVAVEKLGAQMKDIVNMIGTRAAYEEEATSVDVEGTTMTLAEYEVYIRKLELDNRYREAKRLGNLAKLAEESLSE